MVVNEYGQGMMTFNLVGPDWYPSLAFVAFDKDGPEGDIQVATSGAAPEDGFSGYKSFAGDGVARWGDYSSATMGPGGDMWLAGEYIPNRPRTKFANWGTFIINVLP